MIREAQTLAKTYRPYTGDSGLYVSRVLEPLSQERLIDFVHKHGLCEMDEKDINELHCTIVYSPKGLILPIGSTFDVDPIPTACSAHVISFEFWPGHDDAGYLVACLKSKALVHIN